jgi:hypothetical protein
MLLLDIDSLAVEGASLVGDIRTPQTAGHGRLEGLKAVRLWLLSVAAVLEMRWVGCSAFVGLRRIARLVLLEASGASTDPPEQDLKLQGGYQEPLGMLAERWQIRQPQAC